MNRSDMLATLADVLVALVQTHPVLNVTDWRAVSQLVDRVEQQLGPIDIMINNAGIVSPLGPLWETDPEDTAFGER